MRITVIGAGAVGGYFGARLAAAGADVTFIARGETLRVLRDEGLRIESPKGDLHLDRVIVSDRPEAAGTVDLVIVAVKAWQVPEAAEAARPLVGEDTLVLPLQNGIEAADLLAERFGPRRVLWGMCRIVAEKAAPNRVRHIGVEPFIALGAPGRGPDDRIERILLRLRAAGIDAEIPPDIRTSVWMKFLFIAPVSGIGAVTRSPIKVIRSLPETRKLLVQAMGEVRSLAGARGIPLSGEAVGKTMAFLDGMPGEATASMQRDIMEGRPSELEAINGAVVRLGRAARVETPVNGFIYASLLPMETEARRSMTDFRSGSTA